MLLDRIITLPGEGVLWEFVIGGLSLFSEVLSQLLEGKCSRGLEGKVCLSCVTVPIKNRLRCSEGRMHFSGSFRAQVNSSNAEL